MARGAAQDAAAYRLLRSVMGAAEDDELIDPNRVPIQKASTARVKNPQTPSPVDEMATIVDNMPERLRLFIVLAAFAGMREGEIFELPRSDIEPTSGSIAVTRKIEKDADPTADGACPNCGTVIGRPKTGSGTRIVHLPPAFLPLLRAHLFAHTAPGADGLLVPGERNDHMSARYLLDRYAVARKAAGRPTSPCTAYATPHSPSPASTARPPPTPKPAPATPPRPRWRSTSTPTVDRDRQLAEALGTTVNRSDAWIRILERT